MTISIGTIIYLLISFVIFAKYYNNFSKLFNSFFCFLLLSQLFLNVGFFVKIKNYEILYDEYLTFIVFVLSVWGLIKSKSNYHVLPLFLAFFISLLLSLLINFLSINHEKGIPYGSSWDAHFYLLNSNSSIVSFQDLVPTATSALMMLRLLFFLTTIIYASKTIKSKDVIHFLGKINLLSVVSITLSILEFISKNFFSSSNLNSFYLCIFGSSEAIKSGLGTNVGGIYATIGLFREQSMLAIHFSIVSLIILGEYFFFHKRKLLFLSLAMLLGAVLSMSFTSLLFVIFYIVLSFKYSPKKAKPKIAFLIVFLITFIVWFVFKNPTYFTRISNVLDVVFNFSLNMNIGQHSERVRLYSIIYNYLIFLRHPLLGIGIGTTYSHGGLSSVLANIGIGGLLLYYLILRQVFNKNFGFSQNNFVLVMLYLAMAFVGGIDLLYSNIYFALIFLFSFFNKGVERTYEIKSYPKPSLL